MTKFKKIIGIIFMVLFFTKASSEYKTIFYDYKLNDIDGENLDLSKFKDRAVLLVNVASNCGFTKQYTDLQKIWDDYKDKGLTVIGVPSNQFGGQEPGSNNDIKEFCKVNFNVTFPMTDKIDVKGNNAHPLYKWAFENYGKSAVPKWNFHKILIDKNGKIFNTYSSLTKPTSKKITKDIKKILNIE